jgi:hypothetical protein
MAIKRVFNGQEVRIPSVWGGRTNDSRITNNLLGFLYKLGIKSAKQTVSSFYRGYKLKLKLDGKEIAFAEGVSFNVDEPLRDLTDDGSVD